jgi:endonuclease/exonuclease/phosphatase family metal-dependent hydrolase
VEPSAIRMTVASLNIRGVPVTGSRLAARCQAIAAEFDASEADVVCLQEVLTYYHLRLLSKGLPSFRHVLFRRSALGPAGGVVTFSRLPAAGVRYQRFPRTLPAGVPPRAGVTALLKGMLVTELACGARVVNVHPVANSDGDWSPGNRFGRLQRQQLRAISRLLRGLSGDFPVIACGDFNVARDSDLWREFVSACGLADAFAGQCPPTFRAEYLAPGQVPRCIDFILVSDGITVTDPRVILDGKHNLPGGEGHLSDHVGLSARLRADPGAGATRPRRD